ncbi:MAG: 5-formyltetrahydrofolate cyclo-ligase, partial [Pseudomonadota bacterium]
RDGAGRAAAAAKRLLAHLDGLGRLDVATRVAGYRPIRSEIDTAPVLATMAARGVALAMPVVEGAAQPLGFRPWAPGVAEVEGAFGAPIPADATAVTPRILIVPLVAFDEIVNRYRPTMLIVDIEGGEEALFSGVALTGIKKIYMELHQNVVGRVGMKRIFDFMSSRDFHYDQHHSHGGVVLFSHVLR